MAGLWYSESNLIYFSRRREHENLHKKKVFLDPVQMLVKSAVYDQI